MSNRQTPSTITAPNPLTKHQQHQQNYNESIQRSYFPPPPPSPLQLRQQSTSLSLSSSLPNNSRLHSEFHLNKSNQFHSNVQTPPPPPPQPHPDSNSNNSSNYLQQSRKPSLLSGYHNPVFNGPPHSLSSSDNGTNLLHSLNNSRFFGGERTSTNNRHTSKTTNQEDIELKQPKTIKPPNNRNNNNNNNNNNSNTSMTSIAASYFASIGILPSNPQYSQLMHAFQMQQQSQPVLNHKNQPTAAMAASLFFPLNELASLPPVPPLLSSSSKINNDKIIKEDAAAKTTQQQQQIHISAPSTPTSASYVPQVEAISPTPDSLDNQKDTTTALLLQQIKIKISTELEKLEKELASTQYQFDIIKKKKNEIEEEEINNKTLETQKNPNDDTKFQDIKQKNEMTLAERIYSENRKKAQESHNILNGSNVKTTPQLIFQQITPLYHEFTDTNKSVQLRHQFDNEIKKKLVIYLKRQLAMEKSRESLLVDKYDELFTIWQKKADKAENNSRKKQKDAKFRDFYEKFFPEIKKQREERERAITKHETSLIAFEENKLKDVTMISEDTTTTTTQTTSVSVQITTLEQQQQQQQQTTVQIEPNPVEDERKRMIQLSIKTPIDKLYQLSYNSRFKYVNNNGFITDPMSMFKASKNQVFWSQKEKDIFLEKLLNHGKNFDVIASFLDKKVFISFFIFRVFT
jgi:hypothetical protein